MLAAFFEWGVALHDLDFDAIRRGEKSKDAIARELKGIRHKAWLQIAKDYLNESTLELIPRPEGSPDPVPERAKMLAGHQIYISGAPCPMCMSAIYWARIDRLYFGASLDDARTIGFDDAFQYEDFLRPWERRRIPIVGDVERETCLTAHRAWEHKLDRHPY